MNFRSVEDETTFRILNGDPGCTGNIEEMVEIYLKGKNDYVTSILGWKRGQTQKHNWRKYRFSYRTGLKKYHRNNSSTKIRDKILSSLRSGLVQLKGSGSESLNGGSKKFVLNISDYDKWEFLACIARMQCDVLKESSCFDLEEEHVEQVLLSEHTIKALSNVSNAVVSDSEMSEEDIEFLMCLLGEDLLREQNVIIGDLSDSLGYCDLYIDCRTQQPCLSETAN